MDIDFTPDMFPYGFYRCFMSDCPKADTCAHFLAGRYIEEGVTAGLAVFPTARKGDKCVHYKQTRVIRVAYGFKTIFADVKKRDYTTLRQEVRQYLGSNTSYYRYNRGEKLLTPAQQKWIITLFRNYGYTENLRFDHYRDVYDF